MKFFNNLPLQRSSKLTDPNKMAQQLSTLLSGGSTGGNVLVYNTLTDLQTAYPGGTTQPAWVIADNAWYYWSGTVTVSAPADVTGLAASSITTSTLSLSWTASSGATSYDIYQGNTLLGNTTSTNYSVSGLSASTAYTFKVIAKNSGGSSAGVTVNTTTTAAATPPVDVTNLATSNVSNSSATLTWTASTGATSYDVYNGAILLGNTASTNYQATGLSASTAYTFKVVAKNAAGSSAGVTLNVTTLTSAPNPVANLAVGTVTSSSIPVTWSYTNGSDAVSNFEVAYSSNGGNTFTVASNAVNSSSTSYTVSGLSASTAYVIRLVAIDSSGNRSSAVTVNATTSAPADTTPPTVTASPSAGTYTSAQTVTLSATDPDNTSSQITIYYTTDGTTPTTSSTVYTTPISISATTTLQFIGKDTSGNISTPVAATYTINLATPPATGVKYWDEFNRTGTGLGSTDSGQAWTPFKLNAASTTAVFSTDGANAYPSTYVADSGTVFDSTLSDCTVEVKISAGLTGIGSTGTSPRIIFRYQDSGNFFMIQPTSTVLQMYRATGGTWGSLQKSGTIPTPADGDILKVTLSGSTINAYYNGSLIFTQTDTNFQTATKHGIGVAESTAKFDYIRIS